MAFGTYIVLVVTVVILQEQLLSGVTAFDKPGKCPPPSGLLGICIFDPNKNCLADIDCKGIDKCCSEGCGKVCKTPKLPCPLVKCSTICHEYLKDKNGCQTCTCALDKPGKCPPPSGLPGLCIFDPNKNCLADSGCKGIDKCCKEGCGKVCKTPCPLRKCSRICEKYAKDKNGCQTCTCIRKPKPGSCPSPPKVFCKRVISFCKDEFECKGNLKCCFIFCSRRCVPPIQSTPSKPCPSGVPKLHCFVPPCQVATCAQYPQAKCVNNYCGGCNAEFYVGLKRVCVRKG